MSNDTNEDSLFCDSESENHFIDEATAQNFLSADNGDLICEATGISDEAAKIISNYRGSLYLNGLTELSDAAAEALSKHQGGLDLGRLTKLSDAAADALSKHQGTICEMEPEEWVASVGKNELIQKSPGIYEGPAIEHVRGNNSYRVITSEIESSKQGNPSDAFHSLQDGLFLVQASSEQFTRCVTQENASDLISYADCRCIALPKCSSGYWVVAIPYSSTAGLHGADLSKQLATRVVQMIYYDTVGTCALFVWDNGMCVEFFCLSEWFEEHDRADEITKENLLDIEPKCSYSLVIEDEHGSRDRIEFQSSLSFINEADLRGGLKVIDKRFKDLNVPFPPDDLKWLG